MDEVTELNSLRNNLTNLSENYAEGASDGERGAFRVVQHRLEEMLRESSSPAIAKGLERPKVLIVTPELVSLPKGMGNLAEYVTTGSGGGLADISTALVEEFYNQGVNVHVALPDFKSIFKREKDIPAREYALLEMVHNESLRKRIHFISDPSIDGAESVYDASDNGVNIQRAVSLAKGVNQRVLPKFRDDDDLVVHCNDWMTGLIPPAVQHLRYIFPGEKNWKSLMSFHNIFTMGLTPQEISDRGLNDINYYLRNLHYTDYPDENNMMNAPVGFLETGMFAADRINTVSETFLQEIVSGELDSLGIVPESIKREIIEKYNASQASGILNAPMGTLDPRKDPSLVQRYSLTPNEETGTVSIEEGKRANKDYLLDKLKLDNSQDKPLFLWPSRIVDPQKNAAMFAAVVPEIVAMGGQVAVIADGQEDIIRMIQEHARMYPGDVAYNIFNRPLSQIGMAASDALFIPSLYEPCGFPNMIGPKYGTLVIGRKTGGIADTVKELTPKGGRGNGFLFEDNSPGALLDATRRAMDFYRRPQKDKNKIIKRVMRESKVFSKETTAKNYIAVYEGMLGKPIL
jgi:starch synthase